MKPKGRNYKRANDIMKKENIEGIIVYAGYWHFKVLRSHPITGEKEVVNMYYMG